MELNETGRVWRIKWTSFFAAAALVIVALSGCTAEVEKPETTRSAQVPVKYTRGEELFNSYCATCHGEGGRGTDKGPPFLHRLYRPGHHADQSFHLAARRGVIAHHWRFGNMPRIDGFNERDVNEIIAYVRWLQRQAGIY